MAGSSLSQDERATREQMVLACAELRANVRALEQCFHNAKLASDLAPRASRLVSLLVQVECDARSERQVPMGNLRTTARLFVDIAIKLCEACELIEHLETSQVARQHMAHKLARVGELVAQVYLVLDLPMEGA